MPPLLNLSFVILVAVLYSLLILGATYAEKASGTPSKVPLFILRIFGGGFILVTGLAALSNYFSNFSSMPPKVVFGVVPGFIFMIALAFNPYVRKWLRVLPEWWLIAVQSFRIVVEIQLYFLALTPVFPKMMTLEGANFDIVTGLTAPLAAFLVRKYLLSGDIATARKIGYAWNAVGLLFLTNVFVRGILSAPTPFQQIVTNPPNLAIGIFPFNWLPMFVVPVAYLLHILSIRQLAMTAPVGAKG
jgi:hypothetical protein